MKAIFGVVFISLMVAYAGCQISGPKSIDPFTTDGCSDFPDGTHSHKDLWHECCVAHDVKYWAGGNYEDRLSADLELRSCVKSVGEPAIADLMLAGVRVGGSPWWPTRFRWGYGWPYFNGYRELTPEELKQVQQQKNKQGIN